MFAGIGVGSPGPLELPAGRLHHPPNLRGWDGFPLLAEMENRLQRSVILESDANAAALAEYELGLGKELEIDSMCMLTLGTGVGNGIILDGKIWHGSTGMGGEAGHMTVYPEGALCGCGNNGCLEACPSATAIVNAAERMISSGKASVLHRIKEKALTLTAQGIADAARHEYPDARAIYAETGRSLGICVAGLINILNLPLYVIGGGVASSWDLFAPTMFEELERRSYVYSLTAPGRVASKGMPGGGNKGSACEARPRSGTLGGMHSSHAARICSSLTSSNCGRSARVKKARIKSPGITGYSRALYTSSGEEGIWCLHVFRFQLYGSQPFSF